MSNKYKNKTAIVAGDADIWVAPLLVRSGLSESNSQARKAIAAGSVRMDGARISDETLRVAPGEFVLQVGKRNFRKIRLTLP